MFNENTYNVLEKVLNRFRTRINEQIDHNISFGSLKYHRHVFNCILHHDNDVDPYLHDIIIYFESSIDTSAAILAPSASNPREIAVADQSCKIGTCLDDDEVSASLSTSRPLC